MTVGAGVPVALAVAVSVWPETVAPVIVGGPVSCGGVETMVVTADGWVSSGGVPLLAVAITRIVLPASAATIPRITSTWWGIRRPIFRSTVTRPAIA